MQAVVPINPFPLNAAPYQAFGGPAADYVLRVGPRGTLNTFHIPSGKSIQSVVGVAGQAAQAASSLIPLATLGVGILNLGVSAYTAYRVHKLDKKLDGIADGVGRIEGAVGDLQGFMAQAVGHLDTVLRFQGATLGVLLSEQGQMAKSIELLHVRMQHGFAGLTDAMLSIEARREHHDLDTRLRTLMRHYEAFLGQLAAGQEPAHGEVRQVINCAVEVAAWLDSRLNSMPVGAPARLPLLVARGMALRMELDGRAAEGSTSEAEAAEVRRFRRRVADEAKALVEGATAFAIAVPNAPLLAEYVLLYRAFALEADLALNEQGQVEAVFAPLALTWDDGLEELRRSIILAPTGCEPEPLPIERVSERAWYLEWKSLPPGADVPPTVTVGELAASAGVPAGIAVEEPARLRDLVSPSRNRSTVARYAREFGWEQT